MKFNSFAVLIGCTSLLSGCLLEEDESQIRVTHASADAPQVAVALNDAVVDGLVSVDYRVGSPLIKLESGTYSVAVDALLPGDEQSRVIEANLDFAPEMQYDIVALNNADSIEAVVLSREAIAPGSEEIRLDVLHGHPDVGAVDIYLTTADSLEGDAPAIRGLNFKQDSDALPVTLPADTYRIRVTLSGDPNVVFDSGELTLSGGSDLMITAVPNVDAGAVSPVNLLVADGEASQVLRHVDELAVVRVVHAVADAADTPVDVLASGAAVEGLTNIGFGEFRSQALTPNRYDLNVVDTATQSVDLFAAPDISFDAGTATSIYAVGKLADLSIEPLVIDEDLRPVALYGKVRVIHASPTAGDLGLVDIHATVDGMFSEATVVLDNVDFKDTATLNVPAGTYSLAVILEGDATFSPAVEAMVTIEAGSVYSVVATDDFTGLLLHVDNMLP
ncbi:DUF4397 domain-containing protein [Photobacterium sp. MCCC 1A19761]|uniref:DUF4397 domain-containing protein n=1 Tax=Photobacterium sp. MCCC 1A19761 TaxID=3115000 RepID=UPI00307E083F